VVGWVERGYRSLPLLPFGAVLYKVGVHEREVRLAAWLVVEVALRVGLLSRAEVERDPAAGQLGGGALCCGAVSAVWAYHPPIEDGLRREVREETGVRIEPVRLTGVYKNMKLGVVALVFRARPVEGTPEPTEEAADVAWWTAEQVAVGMVEAFAVRILDGLREDGPAVRAHDGVRLVG
jgi:8-oxo-dGTP pyrophosphatase MutT (NUDIX family)